MSETEKHSDTHFKNEVEKKETAIVLFYASWCPFSQRFLPIFEEYAKNNPKQCLSLKMDDKEYLCDDYSIEYYPTVILFKKGKIHKRLDSEHGLGLTEEQFKKFVNKM